MYVYMHACKHVRMYVCACMWWIIVRNIIDTRPREFLISSIMFSPYTEMTNMIGISNYLKSSYHLGLYHGNCTKSNLYEITFDSKIFIFLSYSLDNTHTIDIICTHFNTSLYMYMMWSRPRILSCGPQL